MQDFAQIYRAKADGELLQLALHPDELTPEAHAALVSEMANRGLHSTERLETADETEGREIGQSRGRSPLVLGTLSNGVREFLTDVIRVYHDHCWLFIKLMAIAVVVGYMVQLFAQSEIRDIWRHLPRGIEMFTHSTELLEIWLIKLGGWLITWMALSYSFAAICLAVGEIEAGRVPLLTDLSGEIRNQSASFLRVSLLLFLLCLICLGASLLLEGGLIWVSNERHIRLSSSTIWVSSFVFTFMALLVFSRFSLAVPAVVLDRCRVGQAIFRSDELTEGSWITLASLLTKSMIGGYVAGMCPFWLASWIPNGVSLPSWFPWVLTVVSISAVTVVEATMLIGLALLYVRKSSSSTISADRIAVQLA